MMAGNAAFSKESLPKNPCPEQMKLRARIESRFLAVRPAHQIIQFSFADKRTVCLFAFLHRYSHFCAACRGCPKVKPGG